MALFLANPPPLHYSSHDTLRQAAGPVQAVHACPQLGDYFVVVLASGGVAFYQGGLRRVAHCDAAGGGDDGAGSAVNARAKAVWSGVRGNKVLVLENIGAATDRVTTFALAVGGGASDQPSSSSRRAKAAAGSTAGSTGGPVSASVTLVSSHLLTKPSRVTPPIAGEDHAEAGEGEGETAASASACSAAFLGRDNAIGGLGGGGRSVIAVAWRTSRGSVWTKVVVGADGAVEEFARPVGTPESARRRVSGGSGNGVVSMSPSNGHATPRSSKSKAKRSAAGGAHQSAIVSAGSTGVPAIAAADGGRLLVHGGGGASPRLAVWDATYGVLLEDGAAPEATIDGAGPPGSSAERQARAVAMKVSGDGAHLALAVSGRVIVCPVPVKAAGTLASLLRRKRPPSGVESGGSLVASGGPAFPSVDLTGSAPASKLLEQTGTLETGDWEAAVVAPFRTAEAEVVRSLRDAARRRDGGAFERVLQEHLQQRTVAAGGGGSSSGEVSGGGVVSGGGDGVRKKRRRDGPAATAGGYSAGIIAAAVELCLSNPDAKLWGALAVLVRSGGVSARHHRGLVAAIVEHASGELLEEVSPGRRYRALYSATSRRSWRQWPQCCWWLSWNPAARKTPGSFPRRLSPETRNIDIDAHESFDVLHALGMDKIANRLFAFSAVELFWRGWSVGCGSITNQILFRAVQVAHLATYLRPFSGDAARARSTGGRRGAHSPPLSVPSGRACRGAQRISHGGIRGDGGARGSEQTERRASTGQEG